MVVSFAALAGEIEHEARGRASVVAKPVNLGDKQMRDLAGGVPEARTERPSRPQNGVDDDGAGTSGASGGDACSTIARTDGDHWPETSSASASFMSAI